MYRKKRIHFFKDKNKLRIIFKLKRLVRLKRNRLVVKNFLNFNKTRVGIDNIVLQKYKFGMSRNKPISRRFQKKLYKKGIIYKKKYKTSKKIQKYGKNVYARIKYKNGQILYKQFY